MLPLSPSPFWFIGSDAKPCPACRGRGIVWKANAGSPSDCAACLGTGQRLRAPKAGVGGRIAAVGGVLGSLLAALSLSAA